jgi:Tol biopolymer transport system component
VDQQKVRTAPVLSDPNRLETQPSWSPDGMFLYFASAPKLWTDMKRFPPDRYADLRYDIQRVAYDQATDTWGPIETVVSSIQMGKSCVLPRISPDGRFLLFSTCDYGCFPIYQPSTDLYIKDLRTGEVRRLECNSDFTDSWHTWSGNGRWIVFSSKRPTGRFTRLYLSFIDENGRSSKPFVLPQEDPEFYDSFLYAYNVPELISGPVKVSHRRLIQAVRSHKAIQVDALTRATPKAEPWKNIVEPR